MNTTKYQKDDGRRFILYTVGGWYCRGMNKTTFAIRKDVIGEGFHQFVATTARGYCYQLGFTEPMQPTLSEAEYQWKNCRRDWEKDFSGGAGTEPLQ